MYYWCNKCRKRHLNFKVMKKEEKIGKYYPYRDSMDSESYTCTEITLKCLVCGERKKVEEDEEYEMSKTRMEKYGYKGSHYGT